MAKGQAEWVSSRERRAAVLRAFEGRDTIKASDVEGMSPDLATYWLNKLRAEGVVEMIATEQGARRRFRWRLPQLPAPAIPPPPGPPSARPPRTTKQLLKRVLADVPRRRAKPTDTHYQGSGGGIAFCDGRQDAAIALRGVTCPACIHAKATGREPAMAVVGRPVVHRPGRGRLVKLSATKPSPLGGPRGL